MQYPFGLPSRADIRMSASRIAGKQGINPDLTNQNDAIYNK